MTCNYLVYCFEPTRAAQPARRALAAAFDSAEFHRKARHLRHVDGVVEHGNPRVTNQCIYSTKGFIVERQVELRRWNICTQRPADLHAPNRASALCAAANFVDQFTKRDAERNFEQPAMFDIARELNRHCAL